MTKNSRSSLVTGNLVSNKLTNNKSHIQVSFYSIRCCNTRVGSKGGGMSDSYLTRDWGASGCSCIAELLCK